MPYYPAGGSGGGTSQCCTREVPKIVDTTPYTVIATDAGKTLYVQVAGPAVIILPANIPDDFVAGIVAEILDEVTVRAAATTTLNDVPEGYSHITGQYRGVVVVKRGPLAWNIEGRFDTVLPGV